jgi:predicted GNAT family N-acyltransferase
MHHQYPGKIKRHSVLTRKIESYAFKQHNTCVEMKSMRIERLPPGAADPETSSPAYLACVEIRRKVFVDGQAVPIETEFDGLDPHAVHFIAFGDGGGEEASVALGTARMRIVNGYAKAERIAVLETARRSGIGRALVESIESHARDEGLRFVQLDAQVQATGFYEKLGYLAEGEIFIEAGIDHRLMTKRLA